MWYQSLRFGFFLYALFSLGSMATMSLSAGILGILLLGWGLQQRLEGKAFFQQPTVRLYLLSSVWLMIALTASLLGAWWFPDPSWVALGWVPQASFFRELTKGWYLFWPLLLALGLRALKRSDQERLVQFWFLVFGLLGVVGVCQYFWGWPRPQRLPTTDRFHVTLFFGHHLTVASLLIFPFFACLEYAWETPQRFLKMFFGLCSLVGGIALGLTFSRLLFVSLPFGLLLFFLLKLPPKRRWFLYAGALGMVSFCVGWPPVRERFLDVLPAAWVTGGRGESHYSLVERQSLWRVNLEFFQQHPWLGVGFRQNQPLSGWVLRHRLGTDQVFSGHAHQMILEMLAGTGIIGFLSWFVWCTGVIGLLWKKPQGPLSQVWSQRPWRVRFQIGWTCAWLVFHLNGLTQVNFWDGKVQHQLAWVLAWCFL